MRHTLVGGLVPLLAALGAAARAADDPIDLLRYIPPQANAVAVVNVEFILSSPRAVREKWADKDHTEYLAGAVPVHPSVGRIVLARHLRPHALGPGPVVAAMPVKKPIDIPALAARVGGQVTTVAGEPAVATPNGTILLALGKQVLGVARTDTRQDAARWARFAAGSSGSPLSKYLNAAVYNYARRHHVAVAIDTEDLFEPAEAAAAVAQSKALLVDGKAAAAVETFVAGMRGVLFLADVTDDGVKAEVRLAGGPTRGVPADLMKKFVVELVERNGAALENLHAADVKVHDDGVVSLTFPVSDAELARVMALFLPALPAAGDADVIPVAPAAPTAAATGKYYRAVVRVVDDVTALNEKAKDYTKTALWHETAADKIESLSVIGVDQSVVEFGRGTADRLRAIADSLRGVPVQAAMLGSKAYVIEAGQRAFGWSPRFGPRLNPGRGVQSVQTNLPQVREQQAEVIRKDADNRAKLWEQIHTQQSAVRRGLIEKFQTDPEAGAKK